jgi:nicotinate-nucleotide adenylyltransferase
MRRIGLFGGTFDPPHFGHLVLAEWARVRLRLERVLFMPAGTPPHKRGRPLTAATHRLAMARLAVRGNPAFQVSDLEARRGGPSFTVDTLRALHARDPEARLYFLMGADSLADFAGWHEPQAIARLATLVVAGRPGSGDRAALLGRRFRSLVAGRSTASARGRGRVVVLDNPLVAVSSSELRARARAGLSLRYLVPDAVAAYVERHGLYRRGA